MGTLGHQRPGVRSSVSADIWAGEPPVTCHSSASPGRVARLEFRRINPVIHDFRAPGAAAAASGALGTSAGPHLGDMRPGTPQGAGNGAVGFF